MTPEKNSAVTSLLRTKMQTGSVLSLLHSIGKREYKWKRSHLLIGKFAMDRSEDKIERRPLTKGINATTQPGNPKSFLKKNLKINKEICVLGLLSSDPDLWGKKCKIHS